METQILKVLVGSHAHGLANPNSDYDYRGVYITSTSELLKVEASAYKGSHWLEGDKEDNTSYEISHFLHLATKSNPSILEVMVAPIVESTPIGLALRKLFPYVWSSKNVYFSFSGYSTNQRVKMLSDNEQYVKRKWKYTCAHIRVLLMGIQLLRTGTMSLAVNTYNSLADDLIEDWEEYLRVVKNYTPENPPLDDWGEDIKITTGKIIDLTDSLKTRLHEAYLANPNKVSDLNRINEFLLKVRKENW